MIIPYDDELLVEVYRCPVCNYMFSARRSRQWASRCTIAHPPGSCCHYREKVVNKEQLAQIIAILEDATLVVAANLGELCGR